MYSSFQLAKKYLRYYFSASNGKGHGVHSPFVFHFILNVLNNKQGYRVPEEIESLRKELLHDKTKIIIEDMGAGSRIQSSRQRTIKSLTQTAVKPKKYSQLLFRLVKYYKPVNIIELGTSLGITTSNMAKANPSAEITTIEGSSSIAELAKENFEKLNCSNIQLFHGNFDDVLPTCFSQISTISLGYIDGNHRLEPTLNYFEQFLAKTDNNSILIFDDIHWSKEMEEAWEKIKSHPSVCCTIDIFFLGFVFFREEFKAKQDFIIRF